MRNIITTTFAATLLTASFTPAQDKDFILDEVIGREVAA